LQSTQLNVELVYHQWRDAGFQSKMLVSTSCILRLTALCVRVAVVASASSEMPASGPWKPSEVMQLGVREN